MSSRLLRINILYITIRKYTLSILFWHLLRRSSPSKVILKPYLCFLICLIIIFAPHLAFLIIPNFLLEHFLLKDDHLSSGALFNMLPVVGHPAEDIILFYGSTVPGVFLGLVQLILRPYVMRLIGANHPILVHLLYKKGNIVLGKRAISIVESLLDLLHRILFKEFYRVFEAANGARVDLALHMALVDLTLVHGGGVEAV